LITVINSTEKVIIREKQWTDKIYKYGKDSQSFAGMTRYKLAFTANLSELPQGRRFRT
jgi:hypothetical protein